MVLEDDRSTAERKTHVWIVMMTDSFMSGWGHAKNGTSYAGWACEWKDLNKVENWVRNRSDAKRVRVVGGDYRPRNISGHCHIYVVGDDHPARR